MAKLTDLEFRGWGDLIIEGYIGGKLRGTRVLSASGTDDLLVVKPDDSELDGDGRDATRVVLAVTSQHGELRPFATGAIQLALTGPGEIVGENPFALAGGAGAVWVRSKEGAGVIKLEALHQYLGKQTVEIRVRAVEAEMV
jgi:beta-galactosidase